MEDRGASTESRPALLTLRVTACAGRLLLASRDALRERIRHGRAGRVGGADRPADARRGLLCRRRRRPRFRARAGRRRSPAGSPARRDCRTPAATIRSSPPTAGRSPGWCGCWRRRRAPSPPRPGCRWSRSTSAAAGRRAVPSRRPASPSDLVGRRTTAFTRGRRQAPPLDGTVRRHLLALPTRPRLAGSRPGRRPWRRRSGVRDVRVLLRRRPQPGAARDPARAQPLPTSRPARCRRGSGGCPGRYPGCLASGEGRMLSTAV